MKSITFSGADRILMTRNGYTATVAVVIIFAALYSTSLPGRDLLSAGVHALIDFKVMWICVLIATWRLARVPATDLCVIDLCLGTAIAAFAAMSTGLWPWLMLIAYAALSLNSTQHAMGRQALFLLLAIGIHETAVTVCSEMYSDVLLSVDAMIAQTVTRWAVPNVVASGALLEVQPGHSIILVWGCRSLSYVGDMMLLCGAMVLMMTGDRRVDSGIWLWLAMVMILTVMLNSIRLVLMASDPDLYEFLHAGTGASLFRITIITGAVSIAWLHSRHARR